MALQGYLTGITSATTIANLGTLDDAVVGAQATLISGTTAISGTGSNQSVTVFGAVYGASSAIRLGATGLFDNVVKIAATGQVSGDNTAITMTGFSTNVINDGLIEGSGWGIYCNMDGDGLARVTNHGTLIGYEIKEELIINRGHFKLFMLNFLLFHFFIDSYSLW